MPLLRFKTYTHLCALKLSKYIQIQLKFKKKSNTSLAFKTELKFANKFSNIEHF